LATGATHDDTALWEHAREKLLSWRSNADQFEPEDAPDIAVLDTATDFTVDEQNRGGPAPSSIVPSGNGRVAFEWSSRGETMIVEFISRGHARYTSFVNNKVVEKGLLARNPRSRLLELEG